MDAGLLQEGGGGLPKTGSLGGFVFARFHLLDLTAQFLETGIGGRGAFGSHGRERTWRARARGRWTGQTMEVPLGPALQAHGLKAPLEGTR